MYKAIKNVASIASPLALVVLGGRFKFSSVKALAPQITLGTILRLLFPYTKSKRKVARR